MIGVGLTGRYADAVDCGEAGHGAVDDEDLIGQRECRKLASVGLNDEYLGYEGLKGRRSYITVRDMEQLGHSSRLQHMFDLPPSSDTLIRQHDPTALRSRGILRREICGRGSGVGLRATANEDFGNEVWGRKWEKDGGSVHWVCDLNAIRDFGKESFSLGLYVVDHGRVSCDHEDTAVWECENPVDVVWRSIERARYIFTATEEKMSRWATHLGNKFDGPLLARNGDGRATPLSFLGKNSNEFAGSML